MSYGIQNRLIVGYGLSTTTYDMEVIYPSQKLHMEDYDGSNGAMRIIHQIKDLPGTVIDHSTQ